MQNLVTVTYNLEHHLVKLQSESLQIYANKEPLRHWIVVNEENVDVHGWYKYLKPHYQHHELYIIPRKYITNNPILSNIRGWASQQVLKLLIANIVRDDYILFDSKNFLIQEFSFNFFNNLIGSGVLEYLGNKEESLLNEYNAMKFEAWEGWKTTIDFYCKRFNFLVPKYFLRPGTPFKIDYKIMCNRFNLNNLVKDLLFDENDKELARPSEFLYYSLGCQDLIKPGENTLNSSEPYFNHTLFPEGFETGHHLISSGDLFCTPESVLNKNTDVKIFGFHRRYLEKCQPIHYVNISYWLASKGFRSSLSHL